MSDPMLDITRKGRADHRPFLADISKAWDLDAFAKRARGSIELRLAREPHEMTGAVLYFPSTASSFCTGTVLRLEGGVF